MALDEPDPNNSRVLEEFASFCLTRAFASWFTGALL